MSRGQVTFVAVYNETLPTIPVHLYEGYNQLIGESYLMSREIDDIWVI